MTSARDGLVYDTRQVAIYQGDALERMAQLPDDCIDTIVTSPPYYGLRDYGHAHQLGAETSVDNYVAAMVKVFAEARRILKPSGVLWLNLGDSYASTGGKQGIGVNARVGNTKKQRDSRTRPVSTLPPKNLLGIPWRVALALQADGWVLRADIIWAKSNPMPESVRDRPTKSHEYVFMLTKSTRYVYNYDDILEDAVKGASGSRFDTGKTATHQLDRAQKGPRFGGAKYGDDDAVESRTKSGNEYQPNGKRNRRDVWTIGTQPYKGAHFAVMPKALAELCAKASTPPQGVVLDMFAGSGTVAEVSAAAGFRTVAIELNADYIPLIIERLGNGPGTV